jgi:hypothetical protein
VLRPLQRVFGGNRHLSKHGPDLGLEAPAALEYPFVDITHDAVGVGVDERLQILADVTVECAELLTR